MGEEISGEGGAFAHRGDDGVGFETVDELLLDFWGCGGVVVWEESVAEDGDGEVGLETLEMRCGYVLVVIEDGQLDQGWGKGSHGDA